MKPLLKLFLLISLVIFGSHGMMAQESVDWNKLSKAIAAGNAVELAKHFDNQVELTIKDNENGYSKDQAQEVVRRFFVAHPVQSFRIMHHSTTGGNAEYAIGTLQTGKGSFRTYILLKSKSGQMLIQQLKFTQD